MRILIIEDEMEIVRFLKLELQHEGYEVKSCTDGRSGLGAALDESFDLVLLDVMLPELNGVEVLRRLRKEKQTPVILVTARDAVTEKVNGLDLGANDYMTKPFHIEELLARIRMVLRTAGVADPANGDALRVNDLVLHLDSHQVMRGEELIELTKTQYDLLEYLLRNRDIVLTRAQNGRKQSSRTSTERAASQRSVSRSAGCCAPNRGAECIRAVPSCFANESHAGRRHPPR